MARSQAKWQVIFTSLHDRLAQLSEELHKAVLRDALGDYKLIITPIGMSVGAFTLPFLLSVFQ